MLSGSHEAFHRTICTAISLWSRGYNWRLQYCMNLPMKLHARPLRICLHWKGVVICLVTCFVSLISVARKKKMNVDGWFKQMCAGLEIATARPMWDGNRLLLRCMLWKSEVMNVLVIINSVFLSLFGCSVFTLDACLKFPVGVS
jgi:hypothetical protein